MRVVSAHVHHRRQRNAHERGKGFAAETGKRQVEPDHIRLQMLDSPQKPTSVVQTVERPAAKHIEFRKFTLTGGQIVTQNSERYARYFLQLAGNVKSVFVYCLVARGKCRYQTNVHELSR